MPGRSAATAAAALCFLASARDRAAASVADPRPAGEFQAARARAARIGAHLEAALSSANAYERLLALEYLHGKPGAASAEIAPQLAALAADRTKVLSLQCIRCKVE